MKNGVQTTMRMTMAMIEKINIYIEREFVFQAYLYICTLDVYDKETAKYREHLHVFHF